MNTLERIKAYLEAKNIPTGTAEKACGFGNATLRNAFEGGKGIGSDKIEIFLSTYPDLSAEWLLRGVGRMILDEREQTGGGENNKYFLLCKLLLENRQRDNELYSELAKLMREG